jgi:hypothetical protein
MFKKLFISLLFIASCSLSAQVKLYKVGGVVLEGPSVSYKTGKIVLAMKDDKGSTLHDITHVLRIESSMSVRSAGMWKRFLSGDFKLVGGNAGKSEAEALRYLGWGKRITFAYCYSLIKSGNTKDAAVLLGRAKGYMRGNDDVLDQQLLTIAQAYVDVANGAHPRAQKKLSIIAKKLSEDARPYFYNLQGDILIKEEKGNLAVLSYYKTLLLDKTSSYEKAYAKSKISEIYKAQKDSRVAKLNTLR